MGKAIVSLHGTRQSVEDSVSGQLAYSNEEEKECTYRSLYSLEMTVPGSGIGNRKELHKLFYRVFMPCTVFRGGELHSQQLLVIEPVANRNMLPDVRPQLVVRDAGHHHRKGMVLMAEKRCFIFRKYPA